jgi:hypothetical protein
MSNNSKKKPVELFSYDLNVDDISSEEEMGFDAFLNRASDKNNNKRKTVSNHEEIRKSKKREYDSPEDELVIMPSTSQNSKSNNPIKKKKPNPYDIMLAQIDDDKSQSKPNQISDPNMKQTMDRTRKLKTAIAQTQQSLNNSTSFDLIDEEEAQATDVKIVVDFQEKNRRFTFAVKKTEKFELLAEKLGGILSIPTNHINFKLYGQTIALRSSPNDHSIMDNERIVMSVTAPNQNAIVPRPIVKVANEVVLEESEDDDYKRELEELIKETQTNNTKPEKGNGTKKMLLHVCIPGQVKHQKFKMEPTEKFSKIIEAIYSEIGKKIKLQFEGETIAPNSSPNDYDMEGGEQIDGKFV